MPVVVDNLGFLRSDVPPVGHCFRLQGHLPNYRPALYLSQSAKHSMPSHARIPVTVHRPHGATKALSQQLSDTQRPARKLPAGSLCSGRSHSASKSLEFLISVPVTTPPRRSMDCRPVGRRPEHLNFKDPRFCFVTACGAPKIRAGQAKAVPLVPSCAAAAEEVSESLIQEPSGAHPLARAALQVLE